MRVNIYKPDISHKDDRGNFILIYGDSGVGKSATTIQTAQDPIYWIVAERGQIDLTVKAISRPDIKLKIGYYEGWDDLLETIYDVKNFEKIKTVLFDGLTHVMNVHLADEILSENYESRDKKNDKSEKDMTTRVKGTPEMYGVLSKQMIRLMKGFEQLTIAGIDVICTARSQDSPKWNRELSCAPALAGKEFPRDMKGFFDMIGLVERNIIDGQVEYPPLVSFEDDGSFLSKFTGLRPEGGVRRKLFNIKKILNYAHGRSGEK